jgi:hypothetical protein
MVRLVLAPAQQRHKNFADRRERRRHDASASSCSGQRRPAARQ